MTIDATFGMKRSTARRHQLREAGLIAAETGRHSGGPCPAVALATLAGKSYYWANEYLRRECGFAGRGAFTEEITSAADKLWERTRTCSKFPPHTSSVEIERALAAKGEALSGLVFIRGHVMPLVRGRVLNGSARHRAAPVELVVIYAIA